MNPGSPPWTLCNCPFCHRLLTHLIGATLILCPSCKSLIHLSQYPPTATAAQTVCSSCHHIMLHPLGTRLIICPLCSNTTAAPMLFYICAGCHLYLTYSSTLSVVVCAVCATIHPPVSPPDRTIKLRPLQQGIVRPPVKLPPRHIPWLPSTPVRPTGTSRAPQTSRPVRTSRPASMTLIPAQTHVPFQRQYQRQRRASMIVQGTPLYQEEHQVEHEADLHDDGQNSSHQGRISHGRLEVKTSNIISKGAPHE